MLIKFIHSFLTWFVLIILFLIFFGVFTQGYVQGFWQGFVFLLILFIFSKNRLKKPISKLINLLNTRNSLIIVLLLAFILRFLWIILIPTIPISDFSLMYESALNVKQGDFTGFHNFEYFARFAHDTITVLYFSLFYYLTASPLIIIKFINVLFSTLAVFFIYKIVKQLYNEKLGLLAALLLAMFPPFIMYNSQTMSENLAIPFYLISTYFFVLLIKKESGDRYGNFGYLCLCGITLSIANMFRMVGLVFLIAYIMHFIIYKGPRRSILSIPIIIVAYFIPMYIISSVLMFNGVTETHLWQSKEPSWTSILKGTNFASLGHWNPEDANLPEIYNHDPDKIALASKQIIKQRLLNSSPQKILTFYFLKLESEWSFSDMSAYEWTVPNTPDTPTTKLFKQFKVTVLNSAALYYLALVFLSILSLIKNKGRPEEMNFFLILFCGFVLLLLITEAQARYSFIISWIFTILAVGGLKENGTVN